MKKIFALLLSVAMVASLFASVAFAAGTTSQIALANFNLYAASNGALPTGFPVAADFATTTGAGVTGYVAANLAAYKTALVKADGIADLAALQALVTTVNEKATADANKVATEAFALARINYALISNNKYSITILDLVEAGVTEANAKAANIVYYRNALDTAHTPTTPIIKTQLVEIVNEVNIVRDPAANTSLAEIKLMALNGNASALTTLKLKAAGISDSINLADNLARYKQAIESAEVIETFAALQTIIIDTNTAVVDEEGILVNTAIAKLNLIRLIGDSSSLTIQDLKDAGVASTLLNSMNLNLYKEEILKSAYSTGFTTTATVTTMVTAANGFSNAAAVSLARINIYVISKNASLLTIEELRAASVAETAIAANLAAYKAAVAAAPAQYANGAAVLTMVNAVNSANTPVTLAKINLYAVSKNADSMTIAELVAAGVTGTKAANLDAYKAVVAGMGTVADLATLQNKITEENAAVPLRAEKLALINYYAVIGNADALSISELTTAGVTVASAKAANLELYQDAVAEAEGFDSLSALQALITSVNKAATAEAEAKEEAVAKRTALATINAYAVTGNADALTIAMLKDAGVTGTVAADLGAYKTAIAAKSDGLLTVAAVQAVIDSVVTVPVITSNAPATTNASSVNLFITVTDNVKVEGVIFEGVAATMFPSKTVVITRKVELAMGLNMFTVIATDGTNVVSENITITRTAPVTTVITIGKSNPAIGLDVPAVAKNGRLMLPFRWFGEQILGATVDYVVDGTAEIVTLVKSDITIELTLNSVVAKVNGVPVTLDVAPYATEGRTLVPARFLSEAFGYDISWNSVTDAVTISK